MPKKMIMGADGRLYAIAEGQAISVGQTEISQDKHVYRSGPASVDDTGSSVSVIAW